MNENETTSTEESIVPMVVATAVVTVAAVMAVNGIYQVWTTFRANAAEKKKLAAIIEETENKN